MMQRFSTLGVVLSLVGASYCFLGIPQTFAQGSSTTNTNAAVSTLADKPAEVTLQQEMIVMMEYIVKMLYLFLWPLLAIAGASLDNSLVYGEIFYLDRSLWQFRQMMRTFANFTLGFLLIVSILFSFLSVGSKKLQLTSVLKNLFVAGILINMSRWLVAVMIDLSTVLTVNLGGLPIMVFNQTGDQNSQIRYLTMHAQFDMDSTNNTQVDKADHTIAYSCAGNTETKKYYLPCWIENGVFIQAGSSNEAQSWYGYKAGFVKSRSAIGSGAIINEETIDDAWCTYQYDLLYNCSVGPGLICGDRKLTSKMLSGLKQLGAKQMSEEYKKCSTLEDFLTKAKGMTGPLYNLYATILNMGQIALSSNHQSLVETGINMVMKVIVGIALILPLFALAVVLIMRVVVLWVVIAFSPFLIVLYVFDFQVPGVGKKASLGNILGLIFLPVFATFAISISALFLTLIGRIDLIQNTQSVDALQVLGAEKSTCDGQGDNGTANCRCYKFFGMSICVDQSTRTTGANILNLMSWLVTNFFGIALMWSVIFFALKSNDITGGVSESIGKRGKSILSNTSMIPIPGKGGLSLMSPAALSQAGQNIGRLPERAAEKSYQSSQLGKFVNNLERGSGSTSSLAPAETDKKLEEKVKQNDVKIEDLKKSVGDDKHFAEYQQLAPALVSAARASGKTVGYTGNNFLEAIKDPGVMQYVQENDLLGHANWVKSTSPTVAQPKITEYHNAVEAGLKSAPGAIEMSMSADATKPKTWYWVPSATAPDSGYITKVNKDGANISSIETPIKYTRKASPNSITDWNIIGEMVKEMDVDLLSTNAQAQALLGTAGTDINDAVVAGGFKIINIAGTNHRLSVVLTPGTRVISGVSLVAAP